MDYSKILLNEQDGVIEGKLKMQEFLIVTEKNQGTSED